MKTNGKFLEKLLYKNIPITKKMGLKVLRYSENEIEIKAPLSKNKNDKNTGFAGSIFSIAALSGWGLLTLKFMQEKIDAAVVMFNTEISFKKPVTTDFKAICKIENIEIWNNFKNRVIRKKSGKITLNISVLGNNDTNELKASLKAEYFAYKNDFSIE